MTERALVVNFLGNTAGLEAALKRTSEKLNGFQAAGDRLQGVGKSMTRNLTVPIIGFGVAAAAASVKFQESMTRLHTQAGVGQRAVGELSKGILDMAGSVGTSPQQLADGMYHVASSLNATLAPAKRTSTELKVLKIAAEGAQVGHANLVDVTNALDAAVVSGIKGVQNYSQAMGALNSIVGAGDMTMQDLADALSTGLLAPMKTYGLTLKDVGGALATFGDNNIRGQEAATKLISAVRIMAAPSKAAAKELGGIGLSTTQLADDMRKGGLVGALTDLRNHLKDSGLTASQQGLVISRAFGGRQSTGVQVLLHQLDRLKAKTEEVGKGAQGFSDAWAAFQKTAAFQIHKGLASMQSDLVRFGNDVLPSLLKIGGQVIKGVDTVAHAFTSLPKGAQDAIIKGGLVLAAIGPAMKLLGVFTSGIGRVWALANKIQAWGAIKTAAGGTPLSSASKQLTSSVGTMEVGTLIARSTIAPIAGGAPGTGGVGSTVAKDMPKVEPVPVSGLSKIKSGISKFAGSALKGATIAGIGTLMSQTIGQAIHGAVGKAISTIGTDTSIGAGLGSFFGPGGPAGGAIIGGLVGTLTHFIGEDATSEGRQWANKFLAGLPKQVQDHFRDGLQRVRHAQLDQPIKTLVDQVSPAATRGGRINPAQLTGPSAADRRQAEQQFFNEGFLGGKATVAGLKSVKVPTTALLTNDFLIQLRKLSSRARPEGARVMLSYAEGLARNGKLPKNAVTGMIGVLENEFPKLHVYLKQQGLQSGNDFAKAANFTHATSALKGAVAAYRRQFGDLAIANKLTDGNINRNTRLAMIDLRTVITTSVGQTRRAAVAEFQRLQAAVNHSFSAMGARVAGAARDMFKQVRDGSGLAYRVGAANWKKFADAIDKAMRDGLISVKDHTRQMTNALNGVLHSLGEIGLSLKQVQNATPAQLRAVASGRVSSGGLASPHERGGMIQFGRAGDRGKDMIPVNFGGRQIIVGSGEVGMVLTGDQQAVLNERTADMGGLSGVIAKHNRPHSQGRRSSRKPGKRLELGGMVAGSMIGTSGHDDLPKMMVAQPAGFETGGTIWGVNPRTHHKVKHTKAEWKRIWADYRHYLSVHDHARALAAARRAHPSGGFGGSPAGSSGGPVTWGTDPRTHRRVRHSKSDWGKVWEAYRATFASIPSQSTTAQIQLTLLANQQQLAQNRGDTAGEQKALAAEAKLGQSLLVVDKRRLEQVKRKLHDPSISRGFRSGLLADELALLQEIGSVEANIGTANSTAAGGSGGSSGQFDLMPGSIKLPTVYDVHGAIAAGIAQQPHYRNHIPQLKAIHRQPRSISHRDHLPRLVGEGREPRSIAYRDRRHELAGEGREPGSHSHTHHHATRINVHVHNKRDVDDVADAIDRATGSRLHAQLRAQGLRGT